MIYRSYLTRWTICRLIDQDGSPPQTAGMTEFSKMGRLSSPPYEKGGEGDLKFDLTSQYRVAVLQKS